MKTGNEETGFAHEFKAVRKLMQGTGFMDS